MIEPIDKQALLLQIEIDSRKVGHGYYGDEWCFLDTIENAPILADAISRCELFNELATIPAPPEVHEYRAEVYRIIQNMGMKPEEETR